MSRDESAGTSPRAVLDTALDLLRRGAMMDFADLFATGTLIEIPFAADEPWRRIEGRERLREYVSGYTDHQVVESYPSLRVHETADPEVIGAEVTARGTTVKTGEPYTTSYVWILRVRDGEIHEFRDYWSPVETAKATGSLDALVEALRGRAAR